jgi:hypothetical protein
MGRDNWTAPVKSGSYKKDMGTSKDLRQRRSSRSCVPMEKLSLNAKPFSVAVSFIWY